MVRVDETQQGAHDFTVGWWRELPEAHRLADRAQGEVLAPAWDGLNRDPRFVTGFDGWERVNTSGESPYVASVSFTRTFTPTPNVPVLVRSWHTPLIQGGVALSRVRVTHTVRNYAGAVVASTRAVVEAERGAVDTWVTPDRFGRITVVVDVAIETAGTTGFEPEITEQDGVWSVPGVTMTSPGVYTGGDRTKVTMVEPGRYQVETQRTGDAARATMDMVAAIHVGTRSVDFEELPDLAAFTTLKPYPLLRFMDGIGHLAGFLDDELAHMWDGDTFNPVTAPDEWLRFLATMLGIPRRYLSQLSLGQLRAHLVAFMEQGRPPIGSRRAIAEIAKQWLTGDKQVTVVPAASMPRWDNGADDALLTAVKGTGQKGRVLVSPTAPTPDVEHRWDGARDGSRSTRHEKGQLVAENNILNPCFRSGINGWVTPRASSYRDTTMFETAPASLRVEPTDTSWYVHTSDYWKAPADGSYTIRARVFSATPRNMFIRLYGYDGDADQRGEYISVPAGTWTTLSATVPVKRHATYRPAIFTYEKSLSTIWVDRFHAARYELAHPEYFDGDTPDSSVSDVWVQPGTPKVYAWDAHQRWVTPAGDFTAQANEVIAARNPNTRTHTLLMLVRADELPNRDLEAFQRFMMGTGTIPAGHNLVCLEAKNTWEQWENAVGPTWNDLESRTKTWTDMEAAGVALDY
ncbi:hypothetical protein [Kocuria sp. cx-455]|uniref:hypothetical protein n=1 Tax=Kocuria sp. cx-455 TaxID=2771377 RepID=UPI003D752BC3